MSKKDKLPDYVVTEADYQADFASGLTEDEVMKPGTYKVRRSPWAERLKNVKKVKVSTIMLFANPYSSSYGASIS